MTDTQFTVTHYDGQGVVPLASVPNARDQVQALVFPFLRMVRKLETGSWSPSQTQLSAEAVELRHEIELRQRDLVESLRRAAQAGVLYGQHVELD